MFLIFLLMIGLIGAVSGSLWIKHYTDADQSKDKVYVAMMLLVSVMMAILLQKYEQDHLAISHRVILLSLLVPIGIIDKRKRVIPNRLVLLLIGMGGIFIVIEAAIHPQYRVQLILSHGLGSLGGGGLFLLAHLLSGRGVGMGDVKLVGALGLNLGFRLLLNTLVLTLLMSSAYSLFLVMGKRASLKDEIPFAPFVVAGLLTTFLLGV